MHPPRWHFRLDTFTAALALLGEAVDGLAAGRLSQLEREGLIQRFEYTWELGWKAMRDYLRDAGVAIAVPVPTNVIRAAFEVGLIEDGDAWVAAKQARNLMAHEYDRGAFERIVLDIKDRHHPLLVALNARLEVERAGGH